MPRTNACLSCTERRHRGPRGAFTLLELLIVVAVIAVLISILVPALGAARSEARIAVCMSNVRQLHVANSVYAGSNEDMYVPAAADLNQGFGGRHRWHGVRESDSVSPDPALNTFNPEIGPLATTLADGKVKACPESVDFGTDGAENAFEAGNGGYGYNLVGIGSRLYQARWSARELADGTPYAMGWSASAVRRPAETVMFADAAFRQFNPDATQPFIEYSFCEPPFSVQATTAGPSVLSGEPSDMWLMMPSIHFRHRTRTNVVWTDGHASSVRMAFSKADNAEWQLGWFGDRSNDAFDPR